MVLRPSQEVLRLLPRPQGERRVERYMCVPLAPRLPPLQVKLPDLGHLAAWPALTKLVVQESGWRSQQLRVDAPQVCVLPLRRGVLGPAHAQLVRPQAQPSSGCQPT